jgi:hypothetical protein
MAALTLGLAGLSFGLSTETGGQIQNLEIRESREEVKVRDADGDTVGATYIDPSQEITYDFFPTGATGIAAASPGAAVTVTNHTPAAGLIIVTEVTTTRANTDYKKVSVKAVNYPLITS